MIVHGGKRDKMDKEYVEIDQPIYSRMLVGGGGRFDVSFFNTHK